MSDKTTIAWTDATWNPVRGCSRISPGCGGAKGVGGCYAEKVAGRFSGPGLPYEGLAVIGPNGARWSGKVKLVQEHLKEPLRWSKPRRIFVNSMSDLFHEALSNEDIAAVFGVMAASPRHTFQVLTKRAERLESWFRWAEAGGCAFIRCWRAAEEAGALPERDFFGVPDRDTPWPLPNVWLGVSVENQKYAEDRIPCLVAAPAAVRFISAEPLLGPVDFTFSVRDPRPIAAPEEWMPAIAGIDQIIVGGESGPGARPCALEWIEDIIQQCETSGTHCFVKQLGAMVVSEERVVDDVADQRALGLSSRWAWRMGLKDRKGGDPEEWPERLRVREFPTVRA